MPASSRRGASPAPAASAMITRSATSAPILPPMPSQSEYDESEPPLFFIDSRGDRPPTPPTEEQQQEEQQEHKENIKPEDKSDAPVPVVSAVAASELPRPAAAAPTEVIDISMDDDLPPLERPGSRVSPISHAHVSAPASVAPIAAPPAPLPVSNLHAIRHAVTGNSLAKSHLQTRPEPQVPARNAYRPTSSSAPFLAPSSAMIAAALRAHPYQPVQSPRVQPQQPARRPQPTQLPPATIVVAPAPAPPSTPTAAKSATASTPARARLLHLPLHDSMPQLAAPHAENPLGLTPLEPGADVPDDVLLEVLLRWCRAVWDARSAVLVPFDAIEQQFQSDTMSWAPPPVVDSTRLMNLFAVAWQKVFPKAPPSKVVKGGYVLISVQARRKPHVSPQPITSRFATEEEWAAEKDRYAARETKKRKQAEAEAASARENMPAAAATTPVLAAVPAATTEPSAAADQPASKRQKNAHTASVAVPPPTDPTPTLAPSPSTDTPMSVSDDESSTVDDATAAVVDDTAALASYTAELKRLQKRMSNKQQSLLQLQSDALLLQARILAKQDKMTELRERVDDIKAKIQETKDKTRARKEEEEKANTAPVESVQVASSGNAPAAVNTAAQTMSIVVSPSPASATLAPLAEVPAVRRSPPPASVSPSVFDSPASSLPPLSIRAGLPSDAAALTTFARASFVSTFGKYNTPEDMLAYTQGAFSESIQREELLNPNLAVFIAERAGELVGYAMTRIGEVPDCVDDKEAIELQRLYGIGVGAPLMRRCLSHALWLGRRHVWLGVWEENRRAVAFYTKHHFVDCGTHDFQFGSDVQVDRVMQRRLEPIATSASLEAPVASPSPPPSLSPMMEYTPLPTSASLRDRVLHAVEHAPQYTEERERGCSTMQIAFALQSAVETIEPVLRELVDAGLIHHTGDESHFKMTTPAAN